MIHSRPPTQNLREDHVSSHFMLQSANLSAFVHCSSLCAGLSRSLAPAAIRIDTASESLKAPFLSDAFHPIRSPWISYGGLNCLSCFFAYAPSSRRQSSQP